MLNLPYTRGVKTSNEIAIAINLTVILICDGYICGLIDDACCVIQFEFGSVDIRWWKINVPKLPRANKINDEKWKRKEKSATTRTLEDETHIVTIEHIHTHTLRSESTMLKTHSLAQNNHQHTHAVITICNTYFVYEI